MLKFFLILNETCIFVGIPFATFILFWFFGFFSLSVVCISFYLFSLVFLLKRSPTDVVQENEKNQYTRT